MFLCNCGFFFDESIIRFGGTFNVQFLSVWVRLANNAD